MPNWLRVVLLIGSGVVEFAAVLIGFQCLRAWVGRIVSDLQVGPVRQLPRIGFALLYVGGPLVVGCAPLLWPAWEWSGEPWTLSYTLPFLSFWAILAPYALAKTFSASTLRHLPKALLVLRGRQTSEHSRSADKLLLRYLSFPLLAFAAIAVIALTVVHCIAGRTSVGVFVAGITVVPYCLLATAIAIDVVSGGVLRAMLGDERVAKRALLAFGLGILTQTLLGIFPGN